VQPSAGFGRVGCPGEKQRVKTSDDYYTLAPRLGAGGINTGRDTECDPSSGGSGLAAVAFRVRPRGSTDRAVTSLVANLLLVAVVVVVATVVIVLGLTLLDGADQDLPVAAFDVDCGSDGQLSLVAAGGDPVETDRLAVTFGNRTYAADSYVSSDRVTAGSSVGRIYPNDAEEVTLIWESRDASAPLSRADVTDEGSIPRYLRFEDTQLGSYGAS